jgi:hypothetical protein
MPQAILGRPKPAIPAAKSVNPAPAMVSVAIRLATGFRIVDATMPS